MNMFKVYLLSSKSRTKFQTVILIQLYQKSPFFQKTKEIENSKIISSFENQSFVASNQILNYIVQTPPNHFSKNFIKKVKLYSPKTEIQNERFIQSLYFIRIVCSNIKSPFGQRKFYDYPTSANIQDLKRCPRPCERVRANW